MSIIPKSKKSKELIRAEQLAEGLNIDPRHEIVAAELVKGTSQRQALLKAGYPDSTANHAAKGVCKGKGVRAALMRIAESLTNRDISQISKGRLVEILENPETEARIIISAVRMGLELGGEVGMNKELVMRHEIHVPPAAQEMIARRIMELQEKANATGAGSALQMENGTEREENPVSV
jgi:hypothetical protein